MPRSVALAVLFTILPSFAPGQEVEVGPRTTHEVVKGETLWALAGRYLGNPYRWPLIYEANSSQIQDPDLIEPGQLLIIPVIGSGVAQVQEVMVVTGGERPVSAQEVVTPAGGVWVQASGAGAAPCPGAEDRTVFFGGGDRGCAVVEPLPGQRTAFYSEPAGRSDALGASLPGGSGGPGSASRENGISVPLGLVYASDWLDQPGAGNGSIGTLVALPGIPPSQPEVGHPARAGERVVIALKGEERLQVGDLLQSFRMIRKERKLGAAHRPTGILVVIGTSDDGILTVVSSEYDRIWIGDEVRFAPDYMPRPGVFPLPVESNVTATVLGFPEERLVQGLGAHVFLDVGLSEGIEVGDVFRAYVNQPGPFYGMEALSLQAVLVEESGSTARIIGIRHPGLGPGDRLRLVAKMQ